MELFSRTLSFHFSKGPKKAAAATKASNVRVAVRGSRTIETKSKSNERGGDSHTRSPGERLAEPIIRGDRTLGERSIRQEWSEIKREGERERGKYPEAASSQEDNGGPFERVSLLACALARENRQNEESTHCPG